MRILMRAQIEHDKAFSPHDVLLNNLMGGNIGNWLYQYSLYRALMIDENTSIDIFNPTKQKVTDEFIASVNENYDIFILPLANAFKLTFIEELRALTKFIKGLTIPCIVPGIGIQSKLGANFSERYQFRDEAKIFIEAILEKSSIIGVRGEATGDFFKSFGFIEEQHYTVIGCPSLYTYGLYLPEVKPFEYSENSRLLLTSKVEHETENIVTLMKNITSQHSNYIYAPQRITDMLICYYGMDHHFLPEEQPAERFYDKEKAVCFTSPRKWTEYISKNIDFSIGTRLHGNVAAVLAGVPAFIMATDQRVTELASYHNIASVTVDKMENDFVLRDLIENTDFSRVHQGHAERFNHFVDFLEKNNLPNVYSQDRNIEKVYFDSVIESLDFSDNVQSFFSVSTEEKLDRIEKVAEYYSQRCITVQGNLKKEKEKVKTAQNNLKEEKDKFKNTKAKLAAETEKHKITKEELKTTREELKSEKENCKAVQKKLDSETKKRKTAQDTLSIERKIHQQEIKDLEIALADAESKKGLKGIFK